MENYKIAQLSILELNQFCQAHNKAILVRHGKLAGFLSRLTDVSVEQELNRAIHLDYGVFCNMPDEQKFALTHSAYKTISKLSKGM